MPSVMSHASICLPGIFGTWSDIVRLEHHFQARPKHLWPFRMSYQSARLDHSCHQRNPLLCTQLDRHSGLTSQATCPQFVPKLLLSPFCDILGMRSRQRVFRWLCIPWLPLHARGVPSSLEQSREPFAASFGFMVPIQPFGVSHHFVRAKAQYN